MAELVTTIRDRVTSLLVASPFEFVEAVTPFSFELQPTGAIDEVFRIEVEPRTFQGSFSYRGVQVDTLVIWLARKQGPDQKATYRAQLADVDSITAAVIRDGAEDGGDYAVPDGRTYSLQRVPGAEYAVMRLGLPVDYETGY